MKYNAKSSVTLPADEIRRVERLRRKLRLKSKVAVVRRGLDVLEEQTERSALRSAYRDASAATRKVSTGEIAELDELADETLD